MTGETFGRYRLEELVGEGGMGQVYRAFDTGTDRTVALKVLKPRLNDDPEFERRFRREAQIAAGLNDPHIVPIHGYGEVDGRLYVDMRLVDGRDLGKVIAESGGRLDPWRAVAIIEQAAAALDSAHAGGLVHRDVKPSNILVAANDFVYLIDFGIARALTDTAMTSTGHTIGTLTYMAPERFSGLAGPESDIYSLTCVLYQCLTGRAPFAGESAEQQLAGHLSMPPPLPSWDSPYVPAAFDAVIVKGMAKTSMERYRSATELAAASRAALVPFGATVDARWLTGPVAPQEQKRPNAVRYLAIAALAVVVGSYALVAFLTRAAWADSGPMERTRAVFTADGAPPTQQDWAAARKIMVARADRLGGSDTSVEIGNDGRLTLTTSGVDADQLAGAGEIGQFYARPVIHAIPAQADTSGVPKDPPEQDAALRIMYERQLRQTTNPNVQILALQYQAGRCGDPDVLAGHDDPDLPLVTCSHDGKNVYLLDRALIGGDQIGTVRAGYDKTSDDYSVEVEFTPNASSVWSKFTAANLGTQVAFTIDTRVATSPEIREVITGGRLEIAGFDAYRARSLAAMLAGGTLPMPLGMQSSTSEPVSPQRWTMPRVTVLAGGIVVGLVVVAGGVLIVRKT